MAFVFKNGIIGDAEIHAAKDDAAKLVLINAASLLDYMSMEGEFAHHGMENAILGLMSGIWNKNKPKGIPALVMHDHYLKLEPDWLKSFAIEGKE